MPQASVWVSGPHTPLEFHRVGEWIGCSETDTFEGQCWFADGRGNIFWQGSVVRFSGKVIGTISIRLGQDAFFSKWSSIENRPTWIVRLTDGDFLVPAADVQELHALRHPIGP
jgi:hypothetical protein